MPAAKRLLTGPYGAGVRDELIRREAKTSTASSLWIVPTPLARAQAIEALGRTCRAGRVPRVWCWGDLWRAVREARDDGPARISDAAARAALTLAIDRAKAEGALGVTASVADWPGFRRRVRARVAGWTRRGLHPDREPPESEQGPEIADEWRIFAHYRAILKEAAVEDAEGFANWAAYVLETSSPSTLRRPGKITLLDPDDEPSAAARRALGAFEAKAREVRVVMGYDPEPALRDAYSAFASLRERLIERGYEETRFERPIYRAGALRDLEAELFRDDSHTRPKLIYKQGLRLIGGPQGEGLGLLVAREVRGWLDRDGVAAEDILVLVRRWDDDAEAIVRALRSWGIPTSARGKPVAPSDDPGVSTLRTIPRLEVDGWEAAELVRLLRNGRFAIEGMRDDPLAAARAAALVRDSGVFRGKERILRAVDRAIASAEEDRDVLARACDLVRRAIEAVEPMARPGRWGEHVTRLRQAAATLGLSDPDDRGLERFWDAIDDQASLFDAARAQPVVPFREFAAGLETLAAEHCESESEVAAGTVCVATIDEAVGARGRFVVLANLAEGTFPVAEAVAGPGLAREAARFLRAIGSAGEELILAYPTRDEKGQEILPAGFLDDVRRRFEPATREAMTEEHHLLDPALLDHEDLARSPADARARAVALACVHHDPRDLARLAAMAEHRPALQGAALALGVTASRLDPRRFTVYDGVLGDPAPALLAPRFGPEAAFSPSQLESYLSCPFQFFLKYVLKLKPVDDGDDLDEDYIARGNRIHGILEDFERLKLSADQETLVPEEFVVRTSMMVALSDDSEAATGLGEIERRRVEETFRRYVRQAREYATMKKEPPARPAHLELVFGDEHAADGRPCVVIGQGAEAVRIQGKIDRVDLIEADDGPAFRVIDYKTGTPPAKDDVKGMLMVQLPLYALAVEGLALAGISAAPRDVGYWDLKSKGYVRIKLDDWPAWKARLEATIVAAVARLRRGHFAIDPRKDDCTRYCDYSMACRIVQVRPVGKGAVRGGGHDER